MSLFSVVLELVESQTLDERIGGRRSGQALSLTETLTIARQITEAVR